MDINKIKDYRDIKEYIVIDIETTHLEPSKGHIVEIGICCVNLETKRISRVLDTTICPPCEPDEYRDAWIFSNSDLSIEKVLLSQSIEDIRDFLQDILDMFPVTCYNTAFDLEYLRHYGFTIKLELPCLKKTIADKKFNGRWQKFENVFNQFCKNDYKEAHRGYRDAFDESLFSLWMFDNNLWLKGA